MEVNKASVNGSEIPFLLAAGNDKKNAPNNIIEANPSAINCIELALTFPKSSIVLFSSSQAGKYPGCGNIVLQYYPNTYLSEYIFINHIVTFCHGVDIGILSLG